MDLQLPTLYEYYTSGGITHGLSANQPYFTLNNRNITIYSGAMHYFRVPKPYWRDRLRKMRAAGLNTVETYVPWNLHEPQSGHYDFGKGGSEYEDFLDIKTFLTIAKEEDLLAILRPGPYICSEWEFGGFPSWLLRNKDIRFRQSQHTYMKYVKRYFNVLLPILALFQFTKGGPVIAFQVENEYGSTKSSHFKPDKHYLSQLRDIMLHNGIVELLVTSDGTGSGTAGTLPNFFLMTANFQSYPITQFKALAKLQHNKPSMAMEFWGGWFDHWGEHHHTFDSYHFGKIYEKILKYNASVNIYMFHGGTDFRFMNGANFKNGATDNSGYEPDTNSYDYDAALTENGNYTKKYNIVKSLLAKYNPVKLRIPKPPKVQEAVAYHSIHLREWMNFHDILLQSHERFQTKDVISMENLPINNGSGQSYGYIVYRKENITIPKNSILKIMGHVCDTVMVLVNGKLISKPLTKASDFNNFGFWRKRDSKIKLTSKELLNASLKLIVENWGRGGFGHVDQFYQFKGLWQGGVYINDQQLFNWELIPIEFKKSWTNKLSRWKDFNPPPEPGPGLYKGILEIETPQDTFVDMQKWTKGIVIVNGFVLSRYCRIGPQQALYLPAPFLKKGSNQIVIFEHFTPSKTLAFSEKHIYKTIK